MPSVVIKNSKIQGKGVFANKRFEKGEIVMRWDTSIILTEKQAIKIPKKNKKYLVYSDGKYIVAQAPEKYLNHSCESNTQEKNNCDVAINDIRKGEELTTDYSKDAPSHNKMACNCKSKRCKKII